MTLHHKIVSLLGSLAPTNSTTSLLVFLSSFVIVYVTHFYYKYFTRINPLPGPLPLPIVGNLIVFYRNSADLPKFFRELHHKYGDLFEVHIGGLRRIVLSDAEQMDNLCSSYKSNAYLVRAPYIKALDEVGLMGKGLIVNNNVRSWRYNRQFFTQAVLTPGFNNKSVDWTNKLLKEMEDYWFLLKKDSDKVEIDLESWIHRFTHDMIAVVTTGERAHSMAAYFDKISEKTLGHPPELLEDAEKFIKGIRTHILSLPMVIGVPDVIRYYFPSARNNVKKFTDNKNYLWARIGDLVKRRRKEIEGMPLDQQIESHDMLTSMIVANTPRDFNHMKTVEGEGLNRPMTDDEISGNMMDALLAGTDSTANLFCFVAHFLAKYPQVKKKMVEEIDSIFADDKTRSVTQEDIDKLKYCDAIIKEVVRLVPIASTVARYSTRKDVIGGYEWPAGTMFHLNTPALHRHPKYWKEPEKFNPDRFLSENEGGDEIAKNSFLMFGAGLRICPGRRLAMVELKSLLALIYRKYDIKLVDENCKLPITSGTVLATCEKFPVYIVARQ